MKIRLGSYRTGAAGSARELLRDHEPSDPKDWLATIGTWFIDAPNQSPAWRHYVLSAVHLRPIDGVKQAVVKEPGATHEFLLLALDPAKHPDPQDPDTWSFLQPFNLVQQLTLHDDAVAARLLDLCATEVAHGRLWAEPALSGQVEPWRSYLKHWGAELVMT